MLLTSQPEQEHNLLKLLANKLGDSERSIASRASYHLLNILQAHPGMKGVLVREVADLILKPPSQPRASSKPSHSSTSKGSGGGKSITNTTTANVNARYYGIVTFNQIVLSSKTQTDRAVANKLLEVYFEVFRTVLGEGKTGEGTGKNDTEGEGDGAVNERDGKGREEKRKMREKDRLRKLRHSNAGTTQGGLVDGSNDSDSKLISALLTGVNRALVFSNIDDALLDKQMDTLFRLTHEGGGSFNVAVQALGLIGKVAERRPVSF
jgi:ribosome biogenesis protein MAK21